MIEHAIYSLLTAAAGTIAAERVYPTLLPQGGAFPAVTQQRISTPREVSHSGPHGYTDFRQQINCWARGLDEAWTLAYQVRFLLDGYHGVAGGVTVGLIQITNDRGDYDTERTLDRASLDAVGNYREATS